MPTIAQVQGVAAGGGCAIALACDLRVCTPGARFGVPIARTLGNCLSAANYARLVDLVGPARTKDLLFTGRLLDAHEADVARPGDRAWPSRDEIDGAVRDLAATIAANAPLTIRATKEAIRRIALRRRPRRERNRRPGRGLLRAATISVKGSRRFSRSARPVHRPLTPRPRPAVRHGNSVSAASTPPRSNGTSGEQRAPSRRRTACPSASAR